MLWKGMIINMANKKTKWTIIDTIIVLVVLAALAVVFVKFGPNLTKKASNEKVSFTVMLQSREPELVEAMAVGDSVTLSLTEKDGGVITDIQSEPATQLSFNSIEGEYTNETVDSRVDAYVTIEADCEVTDEYIKTGDTLIKVGVDIPVRGKGYATSGYVIKINE